MPITLEKAKKYEYAIEKFLKAVENDRKALARSNKLIEAAYRYFLPFVNAYMKYTNGEINKAFSKKYIRKSVRFQKDRAIDITTNLLDWGELDNTGVTMLRPATLEVMARSGDVANKIAGIEGAFDIVNPEVVAAVNKIALNAVVEIGKETKLAINEIIRQGLIDGKSMGKVAKELKPLVGLTSRQAIAVEKYRKWFDLKRPELTALKRQKWVEKYRNKLHKYRTNLIARTESMRSVSEGQRISYRDAGYTILRWEANVDACPDCDARSGHTYTVEEAEGLIPLHPACYGNKTEVYSDGGWKLFKDLKGEELILSLNPKNFELEWLPYVKKIEYHYKGEMIHLKNKWFDLMATPNHNQFFGRRISATDRKKMKWAIKPLEEVIKYSEFRIPRTVNWKGKNPKFININGLKIEVGLFCKFMGYWLSEGSITQRNKEKGWEHYQISIAQNPEGLNVIYDDIKELPVKLGKGKDHITCNNKILGKYLMQFGHSHKKYIPEEIKQSDTNLIDIFLDAFAFGDGHKRASHWKEKKLVSNETTFFTSSEKMAGDIGELILKAGGYPSCAFKKTKGMTQKFRNGTYIINHNMWVISWNKTKSAYFGDGRKNNPIKKIDYDGMVYDVELPHNHVLWVKRNGKTCWSGNCRCTWLPESRARKVPKEPIFIPAKSIKKAEKYIKETLNLESAYYEDFNLDMANNINKTLVELKRKYPKINLGKINYTNMGDPETMGILRHTPYIPKDENISRGILYINKEYFGKYKKLEDIDTMILSSHHDGFLVSKNLSELISHEMGHALTYTGLKANNINEIITYQNSIKAKKVLTNISKYAEYNFSESLAEAFVKYNKGDKLSQTALNALQKYLGVK